MKRNKTSDPPCGPSEAGETATGDPPPVTAEPAQARPYVPLLPYQFEDLHAPDRFRWNCWARQTGKSFIKSLRRIIRGLERGRDQIFLSAGERQCRELMDKARRHCQVLQIACEFFNNDFLDLSTCHLEIKLPRGVRIIGLPANPLTARGFSGDVLLDEFAMQQGDREIWAAMFPALLRCEGELDIASTPRGCGNLFYELRENRRFATSTVTLPTAIAQGLNVDAAAIREAMNDELLYRQEFLCEFLDEATAFLTYAHIAACTEAGLVAADDVQTLALEKRDLYVGVDIGRHRDLTVIWVVAVEGGDLRTVGLFELSGASFSAQEALLTELLSLRQVRRCCIDAGGLGMQLAEQAVERFGGYRVRAVTLTQALKSHMAGALRVAVEKQRIRIPRDERIVSDWHSVQRGVSVNGHLRLDAPRREGSHADRFWAAALAVHAAGEAVGWGMGHGAMEALMGRRLAFARNGVW